MRVARFERGIGVAVLAAALAATSCGGGGEATKQQPVEMKPAYKARMAESMMNAGRVGEALELLREAIEAEPDNLGFRLRYGQNCFRAGRYPEAEQAFREILEIDPHLTDAHNHLGAIYQELGRYGDAEREYRLTLADPAYPSPELAYLNLGILYDDQRRDAEAIEMLRKAVGVNTKYFKAHFQLASVLDRIGQLDEAAREYEVAEPEFRNSGDYHYRLGFVYFRLGDYARARESLSRVRTIAPGSESSAKADELLKLIETTERR